MVVATQRVNFLKPRQRSVRESWELNDGGKTLLPEELMTRTEKMRKPLTNGLIIKWIYSLASEYTISVIR